MKKKLEAKITVYSEVEPVEIKVYKNLKGFEIMVDDELMFICKTGREVDTMINTIIHQYDYAFFPRF